MNTEVHQRQLIELEIDVVKISAAKIIDRKRDKILICESMVGVC